MTRVYIENIIAKRMISQIQDSVWPERVKMKDDAELYRANNNQVRTDNVLFLEKYKSKIQWKQAGGRTIDLGCGDGGMTSILLQYLPPDYETLVGCDLSPKMVEFANQNYATDRVQFEQMDIEKDIPIDWKEAFDNVFSFHMLHWVRNQEKALRNVFELLTQGGDCLLVLMARHPLHDMFLALSAMDEWAPYLSSVDKFLSPYYDCQEPDEKVREIMEQIGFRQVDVRCKQMVAVHSSLEPLKSFAMAINPFELPSELTEKFRADVETILRDLRIVHRDQDGGEIIKCSYNLLVVYATKATLD